jgi:cell wall-associated NlpC family hydrolase
MKTTLIGIAVLACSACASAPQTSAPVVEAVRAPITQPPVDTPGAQAVADDGAREHSAARAARHAEAMLGTRYRYGGSSPSTGFDCSGLIQYSYKKAGVSVPRSTAEQRRAARIVHVSALRPGDIVFFDQEGKKNSHAGMYLGGLEFIHAPSSGKRVRKDRIDSPYWRKHLSEVRRFDI